MTDKTEPTEAPERPVRVEGDVMCVCNRLGHDDFNIARAEIGLHHMMCPMNAQLYKERLALGIEQSDFAVISQAIVRCFAAKVPVVLTEDEKKRLSPLLRDLLDKQKAHNAAVEARR